MVSEIGSKDESTIQSPWIPPPSWGAKWTLNHLANFGIWAEEHGEGIFHSQRSTGPSNIGEERRRKRITSFQSSRTRLRSHSRQAVQRKRRRQWFLRLIWEY